jgi:hypothetical protein
MAITKTINSGARPAQQAGFFEFSVSGKVEMRVKVKAGKAAQAKEFPEKYPTVSGNFTLDRLVINLAVPKKAGEQSPIELHVRKQGKETTLAYLVGNQWVKLDTATQGEFLVASHPDWPSDPAVGIGHSS